MEAQQLAKKQTITSMNRLSVYSQGNPSFKSFKSSHRKKSLSKKSVSSFHSRRSHRSKFSTSREPDYEGMIHAFLLGKYIALGTMNYMDDEEPKEDEIINDKNESSSSLNFFKK